jgi:uncharacterized repeat protein (TIGR01451 family)
LDWLTNLPLAGKCAIVFESRRILFRNFCAGIVVLAATGFVTPVLASSLPLPATTAVAVSTSANPQQFGSSLNIVATLTPSTSTGKVAFYDGASPLGQATIQGGQARFSALLPAGTHQLRARYLGDANQLPAVSPPLLERINALPQDGFGSPLGVSLPSVGALMVSADFNGDGLADIAVQNGTASIAILLGKGDGTFQSPVSYALPSTPSFLLAGDFNVDGHTDLAVVFAGNATTSASIILLTGVGDGTLRTEPALNLPSSIVLNSPVVVDINGDGNPDIAFIDFGLNQISALPGNGDGTFQAAQAIYVGSVVNFAIADFNSDGKADLVVLQSTNTQTAQLLLGNGDGSFQPPTNFAVPSGTFTLMAVDLNNDGQPDLMILFTAYPVGGGFAMLGKGDGSFAAAGPAISLPVYTLPVFGDLNGDGFLDLVQSNYSSGVVSVYYGNGDGSFQSAASYSAGHTSNPVVSDFNGDGRTDIAVIDGGAATTPVKILLGKAPAQDLTIAVSHASDFVLGQRGAVYNINVSNSGSAATSGTVTVADTLPAGLTATAIGGTGWSCDLPSLTCTRSDALAPKATYPITLTINVTANAPTILTNTATVSGGGDTNPGNNTASDTTSVLQGTSLTLTSQPNPAMLGQGVTIRATITPSNTSGKVSFYDGATLIGTSSVAAGQATFVTSTLGSGKHALSARFITNTTSETSVTSPLTQVVVTNSSLGFQTGASQTVLGNLNGIVTGDFNGDGKTDVAVIVGNSSNNLAVFLGKGDGTFQQLAPATISYYVSAIAVGDFNGDGNLDLIVSSSYPASIGLLLGNGDGTFQPAASVFTLNPSPASILVADFDGDGKSDIAFLSSPYASGSGYVTPLYVMFGNGDGTFRPPVTSTLSSGTSLGLVGDFNGDGKPDLVLLNGATPGIALGNGDGTFQPSISSNFTAASSIMAAVDLNGDSKLDLVVGGQNNNIIVYLGNGDGTVRSGVSYAATGAAQSIAVSDFNGDGQPDIATVIYGGQIAIWLGNGDGTLQAARYYGSSVAATLLAGEFNGDGRADLLAASTGSYINGTITPLLAIPAAADLTIAMRHTGSFARGQSGSGFAIVIGNQGTVATIGAVTVTDTLPPGLTATAMSGSGWICTPVSVSCSRSDALAVGATYPPITLTVTVANNAGVTLSNVAAVSGGGEVATSNDTATDVVTTTQATALVLSSNVNPARFGQSITLTATVSPNTATGTVTFYDGLAVAGVGTLSAGQTVFTTPTLSPGVHALRARYNGDSSDGVANGLLSQTVISNPTVGFVSGASITGQTGSVAAGDLNGDGKLDLAVFSYGSLNIYLGNGDGTFRAGASYSPPYTPYPSGIGLADFNGDGKLDIILSSTYTSGFVIYLGVGDGTFQALPGNNQNSVPATNWIALGDFNGDGKVDLAMATSDSKLGIFLGNGDATFQTPVSITLPAPASQILVADFNGDGIADLLAICSTSASVYTLTGNGDGTFTIPVASPAGGVVGYGAIGDFDGDGKPDVAVVLTNMAVNVLLGKGDGTFGAPRVALPAPVLASIYATPVSITAADIDGDGKLDLIVDTSQRVNGSSLITTSYTMIVLKGRGDGSFQGAGSYSGVGPGPGVTGDFNSDGLADVLLSQNGTISVLRGVATAPDLTVAQTHSGSYTAGAEIYSITVTNSGNVPTSGTVAVAETLSDGLQATAIAGQGWNCSLASLSCSRSDALAAGSSFPTITVTVQANFPPAIVTASATISGGNELNNGNDTAIDTQTIPRPTTVVLTSSTNPSALSQAVTLTATVTPANATGLVEFLDNGNVLGYAAIAAGKAIFVTRRLPPGRQFLRAIYGGDNANAVRAGGSLTQVVRAAGSIGFRTPAVYTSGVGASFVQTGDFNGDGRVDIAVANATDKTVSVFLGNGDGTFQAAKTTALDGVPALLLVADFDRDGRDDIVVPFTNGTNVLLSNGDGTFRKSYLTATQALAIGDFNGDGIPDLIFNNSSIITTYLGRGDGSFTAGPAANLGFPSYFVVGANTADFDGDGILDLVVSTSVGNFIYSGNGDGSFHGGQLSNAPPFSSIIVADMNNDGKVDTITGGNGDYFTALNDGSGNFLTPNIYYNGPVGAIVGDFNGDGVLDLIGATNYYNNAVVGLNIGNGDGTYQSMISYPSGGINPALFAAADFDGDGRLDLAFTPITGNTLSVLIAASEAPDLVGSVKHTGNLYAGQTGAIYTLVATNYSGGATYGNVTMTATLPASLTATSISGAGWTCNLGTLSCSRSDGIPSGGSYPSITLLVNVAGAGSPSVTVTAVVAGGGETVTNNDTATDTASIQFPDLTITSAHTGSFGRGDIGRTYTLVVTNVGASSALAPVTVTDTVSTGLTVASMSGAGWSCQASGPPCTRADSLAPGASYPPLLVTVNVAANAPSTATNTATVSGGYETNMANDTANDPTTIAQGTIVALGHTPSPSLSGKGVALTATLTPPTATGKVAFYDGVSVLGIAALSGGQAVLTTAALVEGAHVLHAYYSGDGLNNAGSSSPVPHIVSGLPSNGFQAGTSYPTGANPSAIATGDFNNDGKLDLAVANSGSSNVTLLLGNGDGTFTVSSLANTNAATAVTVADFNGDGKADLAVIMGGSLYLLKGNGDGTFQAPVSLNRSATLDLQSADMNNDGKADLVTGGCGGICVLLGNGDGTFQSPVGISLVSLFSFALGDFNGDGKADIGAGSYYGTTILLGNGDGTFTNSGSTGISVVSGGRIAVGDFNGDGKLDLATSSAVSLGNGDGTFQTPINYGAQFVSSNYVAVADFTGDGKADVAVLDSYSSTLTLLAGRGDGTFQVASVTSTSGFATAIAAGDFNQDGRADVAVASNQAATVGILLGSALPDLAIVSTPNGPFTFGQAGATYTITVSDVGAVSSSGLVTVTIQLPLYQSLTATALSGLGWTCTLSTLTCTRSDGLAAGGSYPPITLTGTVPTGLGLSSVTMTATVSGADANPANNASNPTTPVIQSTFVATRVSTDPVGFRFTVDGTVYNSTQTFSWVAGSVHTIAVSSVIPVSTGIQYGFVNWSDDSTALASRTVTANSAATYVATFATQYQLTVGASPPLGGKVVTPASDSYFDARSTVNLQALANTGAGYQFTGWVGPVASPGNLATTLTINAPTTVTAQFTQQLGSTPSAVTLSVPAGPLTYGKRVTLTANISPAMASGRVTFYDGVNVLGGATVSGGSATLSTIFLPAGSNTLTVRYSGDGTYASGISPPVTRVVLATRQTGLRVPSTYNLAGISSIAVGDFNGDGKPDIAAGVRSPNSLGIYLGNGDGTLQSPITVNLSGSVGGIVVGDFNGDGKSDLAVVVTATTSSVRVLLGNGDGTFGSPVNYTTGATTATLALADFNGDGATDILATNVDGTVTLLLGNGDGTFQPTLSLGSFGQSVTVALGDFNMDGKIDVALSNVNGGKLNVLLGNGDGTFQAPIVGPQASGAGFVALDLNGDGKLDLATCDYYGGLQILLGNGDGTFGSPTTYGFNTAIQGAGGLGVGDFNGDGILDLVSLAYDYNDVVLWYGHSDGTESIGAPSVYVPGLQYQGNLVVADFNGDGATDLAIAGIGILLGTPQVYSDLTVRLSHSGNFEPGQTGASYTVSVGSSGTAPTSGLVTVLDELPTGLTATAISGAGWTCQLNLVSCTRIDALSPGLFYPDITVTVSVSADAPPNVVNLVVASGGNGAAGNYAATDPTAIITTSVIYVGPATAGPGVTAHVPIYLSLKAGASVTSLSFTIAVTSSGSPTPGVLGFSSDAAQPSPAISGATTASISLTYSSLAAPLSGSAHLGDLLIPVPGAAHFGDSYTLQVNTITAASSSGAIVIAPGVGVSLSISSYLVGDVFPSSSDSAALFGDSILNTLDLIALLRAVTNIPGARPAACSDRFDAMDLFPADTAVQRGGDGVINTLDLVLLLKRVTNLDLSRPTRSARGVSCSSVAPQSIRRTTAAGGPGADAVLSIVASNGRAALFVEAAKDLSLTGLSLALGGDGSALRFTATDRAPTLIDGALPGKLALAWLNPWALPAGTPILIGFVDTRSPESLHLYGVSGVEAESRRILAIGTRP